MIPYANPDPSSYQERFNKHQSRGRIMIECAFGILKNLFQCLRYGLRYDAAMSCKIILACVCLYNLRIQFAEPEPPPEKPGPAILARNRQRNPNGSADESDGETSQKKSDKQALSDGRLYRDRLALQYFK